MLYKCLGFWHLDIYIYTKAYNIYPTKHHVIIKHISTPNSSFFFFFFYSRILNSHPNTHMEIIKKKKNENKNITNVYRRTYSKK